MSPPPHQSPFLYGLHDPGGEHTMLDRNLAGWVLVTVAIGANPADQGPGDDTRFLADYRQLSTQGLGVIVRLNHGYGAAGTLPGERQYDDFARRCANFVRISKGASVWVIANEPNHPIEWPGSDWDWNAVPPRPRRPDSEGEKITPERYARCFAKVRQAIRSLPGHEEDLVLLAGIAPWNNLTTYAGNANGDWVKYFSDLLRLVGPANADGITLHAYTHGTDPALVTSDAKVGDARYSQHHWHFRTYRDFMRAIPDNMRHLPVYITETDQGDEPWRNQNSGWVREAYREIDAWNRQQPQPIRCLLLYRWPRVGEDRWWIEGKQGVIEDFQQAIDRRYQVPEGPPGPDLQQLKQDVDALSAKVAALQPKLKGVTDLSAQATALEGTVNGLVQQAQQAATVRAQVDELAREVERLEQAARLLAGTAGVPQPPWQDLRATLGKHPSKQYPTRELGAIRRIVVHHTATRSDITPQRVAEFQVGQGLAGIKYHYMVSGDATISWTQPLEAVTSQTAVPEVNDDSVAVALAGTFATTVPGEAQMAAAAELIAWLCDTLGVGTGAIIGRSEVDQSDPSRSPGRQWLAGARYKDTLVAQVQAILDQYALAPEQVIAQLRQRVAELTEQVAALQGEASQVAPLQREIQELRQQVDSLQADNSRLAGENARLLAENARLWTALQAQGSNTVPRPAMLDVVDTLPKHPTLPPYDRRTSPIRRIVVHHTDTPPTFSVRQIADYHVNGIRRDSAGNIVKAQWPGIGYHYVLTPDGTIHWTQRPETRSYHAGNANNDSLGISLIGRFMRRNWDGTPIPADQQLPTPEQMQSLAHLVAWLMQENEVTDIQRVVGHKEVGDTSCPGDQWLEGAAWKLTLHQQVQAVAARRGKPVEYCLLFWSRGDMWAEADWRNAQGYIAHFRPTTTFSAIDAEAAQHVVIVGGPAGITGQEEESLRDTGCVVHRLAGANEAETKAMLDELVRQNTPYPGAPLPPRTASLADGGGDSRSRAPSPDEWTVPEDWVPTPEATGPGPMRVKIDPVPPTPSPDASDPTPGTGGIV